MYSIGCNSQPFFHNPRTKLSSSFLMLDPTYVMLLQKAVKGRQVLNNKLAENSLIRLNAQQSGGKVRWRKKIFDQGAHHP